MQHEGRLPLGAGLFVSDDLVSVKFENLHVLEGLPVDDHPDEGDLLVEARVACRTRVDVEQVEFLVVYHL